MYSGGTPKVDQGGQFFKKFSKVCKMIMSNYNSSASGELSQMWCNHNKQTKPFDTNSGKRKKKKRKQKKFRAKGVFILLIFLCLQS